MIRCAEMVSHSLTVVRRRQRLLPNFGSHEAICWPKSGKTSVTKGHSLKVIQTTSKRKSYVWSYVWQVVNDLGHLYGGLSR